MIKDGYTSIHMYMISYDVDGTEDSNDALAMLLMSKNCFAVYVGILFKLHNLRPA